METGSLSTEDPVRRDPTAEPARAEQAGAPLLPEREHRVFQDRWREVQSRFVDDPQGAVRDGDALVSELVQALTRRFAAQRDQLQQHWDRGDEPDTEHLRRALQDYRSFFARLLDA